MINLQRYNQTKKDIWDNLINQSRNGTFLFLRDYMDYHADRFVDLSFLIYRKGKLVGVIPGNAKENVFYSHMGLTYGGIISNIKVSTIDIFEVFKQLKVELENRNINKIVYKPVPLIYHAVPAQEDIYCLFRLGAVKTACNISSTIIQRDKIAFAESRKSGIRKAKKESVEVSETEIFTEFWDLLEENLKNKHGVKPVHTIGEIEYLRTKFPEKIKLFIAKHNGQIVAGTVLYITDRVVHTQYIAASEEGKYVGAIDVLFDYLINKKYIDVAVFDFGQSTEENGNYLNESLIFQKEGFGGRGVVYETYELKI